jgi:hypothetical protein
MWVKPPLLFVIGVFAMAAYFCYTFIKIWFRPKQTTKSARKRIYKLPRWLPFRGFYLAWLDYDEKGWITMNKVMSIVVGIFIIVFFILGRDGLGFGKITRPSYSFFPAFSTILLSLTFTSSGGGSGISPFIYIG